MKLWQWLVAGFGAVTTIVATTIGIETRYQKVAAAEQRYEQIIAQAEARDALLASEQEVGKLETELRLLELELKQFIEIKKNRAMTEEELAREEYLKQRRSIIEARLLELTKAA